MRADEPGADAASFLDVAQDAAELLMLRAGAPRVFNHGIGGALRERGDAGMREENALARNGKFSEARGFAGKKGAAHQWFGLLPASSISFQKSLVLPS